MHVFLRVGKNLGLQKQQIAHCCKKFCYSRRKMFNSKTEQRINFEIFAQSWTALFRAFSSHRQPSAIFSKVFPAEQTSWPNWQTLLACTEADGLVGNKRFFHLWYFRNKWKEPVFLNGTKDFMKAELKLKMMNVHDAQPHQKPLTITEKLKKLSEKIVGLVFDW